MQGFLDCGVLRLPGRRGSRGQRDACGGALQQGGSNVTGCRRRGAWPRPAGDPEPPGRPGTQHRRHRRHPGRTCRRDKDRYRQRRARPRLRVRGGERASVVPDHDAPPPRARFRCAGVRRRGDVPGQPRPGGRPGIWPRPDNSPSSCGSRRARHGRLRYGLAHRDGTAGPHRTPGGVPVTAMSAARSCSPMFATTCASCATRPGAGGTPR